MIKYSDFRSAFVKCFYADHNKSHIVKKELARCIANLKDNDIGLNVGSGNTLLDERIRNLDIFSGDHIYYVANCESIPESNDFFKLIITQEVLEHVRNPFKAICEIYRVIKPGGIFYCQLPFIIGYHPGPNDFWRFTKEGIIELVQNAGFKVEKIGITVGCASGFYRIAVEFFSVLLSTPFSFLYYPLKAFFSIILFPIKYLDYILQFSNQRDRIPGGYYIIATK